MKKIEFLDHFGAVNGIVGAVIVSLNLGLNPIGYCFYMVSSLTYFYFAYRTKNYGMLYMNATFSIINVIGLVRYLL